MERIALGFAFSVIALVNSYLVISISSAESESRGQQNRMIDYSSGDVMVEDSDGVLAPQEYTKISENGGITRRPCPYTCEDHKVPREHCKMWRSSYSEQCYVEDTRLAHAGVFESKSDQNLMRR